MIKVKNLGLTQNKNLGWTDYVTVTFSTVIAGIVQSVKCFDLYLPLNLKVMVVKNLIFNYCNIVVGDMTVKLSNRLQEGAQNYCTEFVYFQLRRSNHDHYVTHFFVSPFP